MNTAEEFKKLGFVVIKNLVDNNETTRLYEYTVKNAEKGDMDDGQVPGSPSFYLDKEVVKLQKNLFPSIEEAIKFKLMNVFCYHRVYRTGAILRSHKDSTRAEISVSINLGQIGEPWDLWLVDYDENPHKITLAPGDALIYHGMKLVHWRGKLVNSDFVSQVMFHFVDKNGKNKMAARLEVIRKIRKRCRQMLGVSY